MSYTTNKLINNAFSIAGIVSREFETATSSQIAVGLDALNDLLAEKTVDDSVIPYFTNTTFTGVQGQEEYAIDDLIEPVTLTFVINSVRYPMRQVKRDRYFGASRANDIESLPYSWHFERELGGARIFLYFTPEDAYTFTVWGTFRLSSVTLQQDLELTLDRFYIVFLKFQLADRLCAEYAFETPDNVTQTLKQLYRKISKKSAPLDLRMKKISSLTRGGAVNYGKANLGRGWEPY